MTNNNVVRKNQTGELSGPGTGVSGGQFAAHAGGAGDVDADLDAGGPVPVVMSRILTGQPDGTMGIVEVRAPGPVEPYSPGRQTIDPNLISIIPTLRNDPVRVQRLADSWARAQPDMRPVTRESVRDAVAIITGHPGGVQVAVPDLSRTSVPDTHFPGDRVMLPVTNEGSIPGNQTPDRWVMSVPRTGLTDEHAGAAMMVHRDSHLDTDDTQWTGDRMGDLGAYAHRILNDPESGYADKARAVVALNTVRDTIGDLINDGDTLNGVGEASDLVAEHLDELRLLTDAQAQRDGVDVSDEQQWRRIDTGSGVWWRSRGLWDHMGVIV